MIFDSRSQPHGSPSLDGATIRHPKSRDWEPCKTCGERLDFGTNGMGKLVPACPVCDWGWRPSRDYVAYRQRVTRITVRADDIGDVSAKFDAKSCECGRVFLPKCSAQKHCTVKCAQAAQARSHAKMRAARLEAGLCRECGKEPMVEGLKSCAECRAYKARRKRKAMRTVRLCKCGCGQRIVGSRKRTLTHECEQRRRIARSLDWRVQHETALRSA